MAGETLYNIPLPRQHVGPDPDGRDRVRWREGHIYTLLLFGLAVVALYTIDRLLTKAAKQKPIVWLFVRFVSVCDVVVRRWW